MRWFKHFTDNHRGRSVQDLLDNLGHTGLCYFLLMEICAEKLEKTPDRTLEDADCSFRFHQRVVRQNLRISPAKLERLLGVCQANGLLSFQFIGNELEIKMPMLLELLDYDSKKSRQRRASVAPGSRLDTYTDKDTDTEPHTDTESETEKESEYCEKMFEQSPNAEKKAKKKSPSAVDNKASALVAHYCDEFKFRYKVNPSISRADSGVLKKLFQDMGLDRAKELIRAYFEMPEPYIIKSKHPIKLLSYKINEVLVFAETGAFISTSQVRSAEKAQASNDLLRQIESGNI